MKFTDTDRLHWCARTKCWPIVSQHVGFGGIKGNIKPQLFPWEICFKRQMFFGMSVKSVIDQAMKAELMEILQNE